MTIQNILVCDNGTGSVKCGYSTNEEPSVVIPSIVGRPVIRFENDLSARTVGKTSSFIVGEEAAQMKEALDISYPIEGGVIRDFDNMIHIWNAAFQRCFADGQHGQYQDAKILVTETALTTKKNREKMAEIMFETFGFESLCVSVQSVLTLYSQGVNTGVVVESGEGMTNIVPVFEGFSLPHLIRRLDVTGRDITKYLVKLLFNKGYAFNRSYDLENVRTIKEKFCYIGLDLQQEQKLARETTCLIEYYTLPDGRKISLGEERFEAPEAIFQPHVLGLESAGLHEQLFTTIQSADIDMRSELYNNVYLSGGSTLFPGLSTRLDKELRQLYTQRVLKGDTSRSSKVNIRIHDPPNRGNLAFSGGCFYANAIKWQPSAWANKKEWQENGPLILDKFNGGRF